MMHPLGLSFILQAPELNVQNGCNLRASDSFERGYSILRNKGILMETKMIFLENKDFFAKGVWDFGNEMPNGCYLIIGLGFNATAP